MKAIRLAAALVIGLTSVSQARQLQGEAKQFQEAVAAQLEVSTGRVKAWPNGNFKVYASSVGANDSQRDDMVCEGQVERVADAVVVGNLTDCLDALDDFAINRED